jgi:hypothetical protein
MKQILIILAFSACLLFSSLYLFAQSPTVVMQWGTHLDTKQNTISRSNWCYAIKETKDGGFIACGYSGHPTGNTVGPAIVKLDPLGNVIWHHQYDPTGIAAYGALTDIIETSNGNFAAVGEQQGTLPYYALLIVTDPFGNAINTSNWVLPAMFSTTQHEHAANICEAPDGKFLVTLNTKNGTIDQGFIIKTDGFTVNSTNWTSPSFFGSTKYGLSPIKIGVTSGSDYDIITSGWHQVGSDITITGNNCIGSSISYIDKSTDIDAYRIHYTGSTNTYTTTWNVSYPHSDFIAKYYYDDKGPYSVAFGNGCCNSSFLDNYFNYVHQDVPSQLIVSKNQNEIEICCYVDLIWPQDLNAINTIGGVLDCTRLNIPHSTSNTYGEYKDASGYVIKISYANGTVTLNAFNPIHVGHFSGDDFRLGMTEDACENIYVAGTTADSHLDPVHSTDLSVPAIEDALVCKIANDHTRLWRRNFNSPGLDPDLDNNNVKYDENCPFNITLNSKDNSVVIVGNNGENDDDMFFTKLSSDEQLKHNWDFSNYNVPVGVTNWPGNGSATPLTIKERILIPSGATLIIENCTIEFGETRELFDFSDDPYIVQQANVTTLQGGIIIQKGGKLIVRRNAILRGLERDPNNTCSRDYMWDGISIEGNPQAIEDATLQGVVEISEGATIRDARCGMRFDSRNWFNNQNSISTLNPQNSNETWVWDRGRLSYPQYEGNGGGFVHADNSYFINNRKDAEFLPYTFASSGSYFNSNTFSCTGPLVDPDFHYYDFFENYMGAGVNTHISIWDVHHIPFVTNTFDNLGLFQWDHRGAGISSIDADYDLTTDNNFNSLTYGIHASDINSTATISSFNSHFRENSHGIYNLGINFQQFVNNEFYVGRNESYFDYGIYLEECTGYTIQQNDFFNLNYWIFNPRGIIDYFVHPNQNDDLIYNNYFEGFNIAALTQGFLNNGQHTRGLQLHCNKYNSNNFDQYHPDLGLGIGQGIRYEQGGPNPYTAANNDFITSCNVPEGELFNESSSDVLPYIYYHCLNGSGVNTEPTVGCYTNLWVTPTSVFQTFDPIFCPDIFRTSNEEIRSSLQIIKQKKEGLLNLLDGGDKESLINTINSGSYSQIMNALRSTSPFISGEVITLLIRSAKLPDDSLNVILQINSPLPKEVLSTLISDVTVSAGNEAPDVNLNTTTINSSTNVTEPEVQVNVKSIKIQTDSLNPSIEIFASSVEVLDEASIVISSEIDSIASIANSELIIDVQTQNHINTISTTIHKIILNMTGLSPADSINSLIKYYGSEYNHNVDELIISLLANSSINGVDSIISLLHQESDINRKMELVHAYISKRDYSDAHGALDSLQINSELINFISINNLILNYKEQNKSLFEIKNNTIEYQLVNKIAQDSAKAGYAIARSILSILDDKYFPEVIYNGLPKVSSFRISRMQDKSQKGENILRNYPNPFSNSTLIEANVDENLMSPILVIVNSLGIKIFEHNLHSGLNKVLLPEGLLEPGIYFYSIYSNESRITTGKMISLK